MMALEKNNNRYRYVLTNAEREQILSGTFPVPPANRISCKTFFIRRAYLGFCNRRQGQLNSPLREGGNKLGPHDKKKKKKVVGIPLCPPNRNPPKTVEDDIAAPSENVGTYLLHLRNIKKNTYTQLINEAWGSPDISDEGYRILYYLPQTPAYRLHYLNRIFSSDSWQNIPREDRKILFASFHELDFRSLHFEIFMMLARKFAPDRAAQLQQILDGKNIWKFFEDEGIEKQDAKTPVLMLINCKSSKNTLRLLQKPERQISERNFDDNWVPSRTNMLSVEVVKFVRTVSRIRNIITTRINEDSVKDAFGKPLPRLTPDQYFELKGIWKPWYKLVRTDLNALYSSYELMLMTDLMCPTLKAYKGTKIVLQLHDGVYVSCLKKYEKEILRKLKKDSDRILMRMDIRSELCSSSFPPTNQFLIYPEKSSDFSG